MRSCLAALQVCLCNFFLVKCAPARSWWLCCNAFAIKCGQAVTTGSAATAARHAHFAKCGTLSALAVPFSVRFFCELCIFCAVYFSCVCAFCVCVFCVCAFRVCEFSNESTVGARASFASAFAPVETFACCTVSVVLTLSSTVLVERPARRDHCGGASCVTAGHHISVSRSRICRRDTACCAPAVHSFSVRDCGSAVIISNRSACRSRRSTRVFWRSVVRCLRPCVT